MTRTPSREPRRHLIALACLLLLVAWSPPESPARTAHAPANASPRMRYTLNEGWRFTGSDPADAQRREHPDGAWSAVNLPHTWNAEDTLDDAPGYRRGVGWYRRDLFLGSQLRGRRLFLYFEGANQVADVYLNGSHVGQHVGGYTAFAFEITDFVRFGDASDANLIAVRIDNSLDKDVPPINGDFNMYGGIYRDVWLLATDAVHIKVTDAASPGVWIDTPRVSDDAATVRVRGSLVNDGQQAQTVEVISAVNDAAGRTVATLRTTARLAAKEEKSFEQLSESIPRPRLWSPARPYLYTVRTSVQVNGRVVDDIANPLGFRWFSFDARRGFFLNGQHLKLRGTNRHQDYPGLGNAVPDALHVRDLEIIKDAGFNFVRLAHYPQDPCVLEAADRLGLILWEEIPVVNQITPSASFAANARRMLTEMIRQHRNHPSVVLWGYMNEVFLPEPKDGEVVRATVKLARELEEVCRLEDPARATAIAFDHGARDLYNSSGLGDVTEVVGWNLYHGWYYETFADFGKFLDEEHRRFPRRPLIVSEYGANGDTRLHSRAPRRYDSTIEWQRMLHEAYLPQINARPFVAGGAVWSQFDFGSEFRGETIPHINQKGMFTSSRQPKDVHYFYKANFSTAPVLRIATRDWLYRTGASDTGGGATDAGRSTQAIDVYTNLEAVELFHDGRSLGRRRVGAARRVTWEVPF
ncbi:MAG TPA: glycoside hydrolase family 2 TIM barrel-domain containing protein, partial [Pyrinomonadaceae bacterium]|nr:glycoside hydrolase family 2 TIM barrel-domain containing protein [Pyrinomonadaceae bacterium]